MKKLMAMALIIGMRFMIPSATLAYTCSAGGEGASACSVTTTVMGSGVTYSITCSAGYYACCHGVEGAKCIANGTKPEKADESPKEPPKR